MDKDELLKENKDFNILLISWNLRLFFLSKKGWLLSEGKEGGL